MIEYNISPKNFISLDGNKIASFVSEADSNVEQD